MVEIIAKGSLEHKAICWEDSNGWHITFHGEVINPIEGDNTGFKSKENALSKARELEGAKPKKVLQKVEAKEKIEVVKPKEEKGE